MVKSKHKRPKHGIDITLLELGSFWLGCSKLSIKATNGRHVMDRWYLASIFGWRLMLHKWVEGDDLSRGFHDHPWQHSWTFILRGKYTDCTPLLSVRDRRAGRIYHMGPGTKHAAINPWPNTWSLFLASPRVRSNFSFYNLKEQKDGSYKLEAEEFDPAKHSQDHDAQTHNKRAK